jgi:hypothetical protein
VISHPPEVDHIVRRFVVDFGADAATWYLLGSHADGSAIDLSDIDLLCLFRTALGVAGLEWGARVESSYGGRVDIYMQHPQSINTVLNAHVLAMRRRFARCCSGSVHAMPRLLRLAGLLRRRDHTLAVELEV